MKTNRKLKFSKLRAAALPALVVSLFAGVEALAAPPAHAPAHGWRSMQEGYPPGPPPHAPAHGWRGMQEGYGPGPRIPGASEQRGWWGPWIPGYDGEAEREREWRRQWERDYRRWPGYEDELQEEWRQREREYRDEQRLRLEREPRGRGRGGPPYER
jgi:hypothetical protein